MIQRWCRNHSWINRILFPVPKWSSDKRLTTYHYHPCYIATQNKERIAFFFHGNHCNIVDCIPFIDELARKTNQTIIAIEYYGYWNNAKQGKPTQDYIESDMKRVLDRFFSECDATIRRKISFYGHSLGSAIACYLATQFPIEKLVLIAPFTNVRAVVKEKIKIGHLLLFNRFRTDQRIRHVRANQIIIYHGDQDDVILVSHSEQLAKLAKQDKRRIQLWIQKNRDHNTILQDVN